MDLNHARLPIPPLRHALSSTEGWTGSSSSVAKGLAGVKPGTDLIMAETIAVNSSRVFGIYEELPLFVKDMSG